MLLMCRHEFVCRNFPDSLQCGLLYLYRRLEGKNLGPFLIILSAQAVIMHALYPFEATSHLQTLSLALLVICV